MTGPEDFHVPGVASGALPRRCLPGTGIEAPVLPPTRVQRVWQHMQQAAARWCRLDVAERIERLSRLTARLLAEGPGEDAGRLSQSTGLSAAGMQAAWEVTLRPWHLAAFEDLLRQEHWGTARLAEDGRLPRRLLHVLSGNVLPPTWSLLMRSWLLGAATWLRPAAREPLFAALTVRRAMQHEPLLRDMTAVTWWPHEEGGIDPMARAVCEGAQVVTLHGSDNTVDDFRRQLQETSPRPRFVPYGSRWSAVLLGRDGMTRQSAQRVARDVALFDQQGCLSPTHVFAFPGDGLEAWCGWLAEALEELERTMPRGEPGPRARASLRHWYEEMRLHQVQGGVQRTWGGGHGTPWCVVLTGRLQDMRNPLDRSVVVQPLESREQWQRVLGTAGSHLQGVAVAPAPERDGWVREILQQLQPTWVCPVGRLQEPAPAWRQDHRSPLRSLLVDAVSGGTEATRS